jgi:hypothetical protein
MGHHAEPINLTEENYKMSSRTKSILFGIMAIGLVLTVIGIFQIKGADANHDAHALVSSDHDMSGHASEGHHISWQTRLWANVLLNGWYAFLVAVFGTFFIAVNYLANAGWSAGIKRVPEAMGMLIPLGLVLILIATFFGGEHIYHWMLPGISDPESPNFDAIIKGKTGLLNKWFLYGFAPLIILIFYYFHVLLRKQSLKEDKEGGLGFFKKSNTLSAGFTVLFAFTFAILVWVFIMSIDPHWYSTIYAIYNFAIAFVCGVTVLMFLVLFLKSQGHLSFINGEHIHDLGKYMFAFSIFWTYIWLSQYLLIWYANIPEESKYFWDRLTGFNGKFEFQFWFNLVLCFILPFLGFMTRNAKRNPNWIYIIGSIILIGHWNDLYLLIMPGSAKDTAGLGLLELGMPLVVGGLFTYLVLNFLQKAPLFPVNHPYLEESVHHDVGV